MKDTGWGLVLCLLIPAISFVYLVSSCMETGIGGLKSPIARDMLDFLPYAIATLLSSLQKPIDFT